MIRSANQILRMLKSGGERHCVFSERRKNPGAHHAMHVTRAGRVTSALNDRLLPGTACCASISLRTGYKLA